MVQIQIPSREAALHRVSFAGLMDLFDANYQRIIQLHRGNARACRSRAPESPDLFSEVLQQHPYTTELRLTYCFAAEQGGVRDPDAYIRIYHDARQAELIACHPGRRFRKLHAPWVPSRDEMRRRWMMNRFLHKWLGYLLNMGHGPDTFRPVSGLPGQASARVAAAGRAQFENKYGWSSAGGHHPGAL